MPISPRRKKKTSKYALARHAVREAQDKVRKYEAFVERVRVQAVKLGEYSATVTRRALSLEELVLKTREALKKGDDPAEVVKVLEEAIEGFFVVKELPAQAVPVSPDVNPALEGLVEPVAMEKIDPMVGYQADVP
jgi:hypothetical protein